MESSFRQKYITGYLGLMTKAYGTISSNDPRCDLACVEDLFRIISGEIPESFSGSYRIKTHEIKDKILTAFELFLKNRYYSNGHLELQILKEQVENSGSLIMIMDGVLKANQVLEGIWK